MLTEKHHNQRDKRGISPDVAFALIPYAGLNHPELAQILSLRLKPNSIINGIIPHCELPKIGKALEMYKLLETSEISNEILFLSNLDGEEKAQFMECFMAIRTSGYNFFKLILIKEGININPDTGLRVFELCGSSIFAKKDNEYGRLIRDPFLRNLYNKSMQINDPVRFYKLHNSIRGVLMELLKNPKIDVSSFAIGIAEYLYQTSILLKGRFLNIHQEIKNIENLVCNNALCDKSYEILCKLLDQETEILPELIFHARLKSLFAYNSK